MRMKDYLCPEGKCNIEKGINLKMKIENAGTQDPIESAKWNICKDFRFAYEVDIELHELDLYLTKLAHELKQETRK